MPTPNKPTTEELKAKEEEAIKAAEELEGRQQLPQDETEEVEDENPEVVVPPKEEREQEEELVEEEVEPSKELYKKKFSASSRENQKINAKNRVINKAIQEAEDIPEPTEEEMQSLYGDDWDLMSDVEKTLAKETVISRNWRKVISESKDQATKIEKWNESVETFVDDPKTLVDNPELEGKTEEFKTFAIEEANNSVPFNILVSAFLHEHSKNGKSNKGKMFERGTGGSNDKPQLKKGTITLEEGRRLRETEYAKWKELLTQGKIESDL